MSTSNSVEVLITIPFPDKLLAILSEVSPRLHIRTLAASKAIDIPDDSWEPVEILYTSRVFPTPEQAPKLRWIQFHYAGVDHALDAPIIQKPDLVATSLSGAAAPSVAELTLTLMLALKYRLMDVITLQKQSTWSHEQWKDFPPQELGVSTVGIVGYGSAGRQIARLLHAFGSTTLATKRDAMHPEDNGYTIEGTGDPEGDLVHRLYPPQALRSMLRECDYIVVTVPLTPETHHMIGAQEFDVLKPSTLLVDVSRGKVIDQDALIMALTEKKIAGAALDVFSEEPLPEDNPLWQMSNVIITPHIAGYSSYFNERAVALFAENLDRYLTKQSLLNTISLQRGY